jgi:hypothetical protein
MKGKNLAILAAVVIALLVYILLFERHQPTSDEARRDADKVFRSLEEDDVTGILVVSPKRRVRLEKLGDEWRLREPIDYPADASIVSSTLGSLANLSSDRRLAAGEVDLAEYGLDDPAAEVTLTLDDGSDISFTVGDEMPLGSKRPVMVDAGGEIAIVPGWFIDDLERDVDDWRSREVMNVRADQVASIEIEAGDDTIRAVRVGRDWQLLSPVKDLADRDHLEGLVSDLDALRIEEFLDSGVDPAVLGLDAPEYSVMVVRSDGEEPLRLDLGATRQGDGGVEVACRRGDGDYFWAQDRVRTRLSKAPVLWRSKKVADFDTWDVEGLRLISPTASTELEKVDFQWRFAGDGGEADQARVSDRLTALSKLEATDFDLMAPMTDEMGRAEVVLRAAEEGDEQRPITFTFFAPLSEGGRAMVRVSGRETLMGVDPAAVASILANPDDLRRAAETEEVPEAE